MRSCVLASAFILVVAIGTVAFESRAFAAAPVFTDDPLVAGSTTIKAVHITELRTAVNSACAAAGIATPTYTDPTLSGVVVKAVHISELRSAIAAARSALHYNAATFTDPTLTTSTPIKAAHIQELRTAVTLTLVPPSITSFSAAQTTVPPNGSTQLTAVFSGGTAVVRNNVNSSTVTLTSGVPTAVTVSQNTTYTLTVTDAYGDAVTAMTSVATVMPTITLTRPAPLTTQLTAGDDVRCTPGPCPDSDPLQYAFSASTTAVDGSLVTFLLNGSPLGSAVAASASVVQNVARSIPNGPAQQISVRVVDPYGNIATSNPITLLVNSVPPSAVADQYDTRQNTSVNIAAPGALANDSLHQSLVTSYGATTGTEQPSLGWETPTTAGGSVTMDANGGFNYLPPSSSYVGTDTFKYTITNISGSSTATISIFVYSASCGSNTPVVTFNDAAGSLPFDDHLITASAHSADDDPSICPAQFLNSSYTFTWAVVTATTRYAFDSITPMSGVSSQALFRTGEPVSVTLRATATGNKSGQLGASNLTINTGCSGAPIIPPITYTVTDPQVTAIPGVFRDDTVRLNASNVVFPCESAPRAAFNWSFVSDEKPSFDDNTSRTPAFVVNRAGYAYQIALVASDEWGDAATSYLTLASNMCGAYSPSVQPSATPGPLPGDPLTLSATATSPDNNPSQCPARFAVTFTYQWSANGPATGSSTFTSPTSPVTTWTPGMPGQYTITAKATSSSGFSSTTSLPLNIGCGGGISSSLAQSPSNPVAKGAFVTLLGSATDTCFSFPQYSYTWSLTPPSSDGTTLTTSGNSATFAPQSVGTYTASVTTADAWGNTSIASTTVNTCPPPTSALAVTSSLPAAHGTQVTLHDSAVSNCSVTPNFTYSWSVYPNDDGTTVTPNGADLTFTPATATTYTVTVTAKEASGGTTTSSITVTAN